MPRTKKKPQKPPQTELNGPVPDDVLTLAEAAAYLRLFEADVLSAVTTQDLPARHINGEWRFWKSAIQQWLASGSPKFAATKEAQLAVAGKYRNDPDLLRICDEAYEQRKKTRVEEE